MLAIELITLSFRFQMSQAGAHIIAEFENIMDNNGSYDFILDSLKLEKLVVNRKDTLIAKMEKKFGGLREQSCDFVNELILLVKNNPQAIIDFTTSFLHNRENLSKLIEAGYSEKKRIGTKEKALPDKLKSIADIYELSGVFTLAAILLNKGNLKPDNLKNSKSVLFHLKLLGLTSKDIENIRLVRNASSHKYTFENKQIVWENNHISFEIIDALSEKLDNLLNWNLTIIIYSIIFIPKFGILTALSMFAEMGNNNGDWEQYINSLNLFYNDILTEMRIAKENSAKNITRKQTRTIRDNSEEIFLIENFVIIFERLSWHLNSIADMFSQLTKSIDSIEEKKLSDKIGKWFTKQASSLTEVLKEAKGHPNKLSEYFSNRIGLNIK